VVDGLERLEAPCFDLEGRLHFSDIAGPGAIYRIDTDGKLSQLWSRSHVGGLVPHARGGLVASGSTVSVLDDAGERVVMDARGGWGFNDLTTDHGGNVFAGLHAERPTIDPPELEASLWRIAPGATAQHCYGGIQMTNGLRVSPDGARLYHNDTLPRIVWVSDLDENGLPANRRVHHELQVGLPDGMAVDESGCIWVAAVGAGKVVRITPDGKADLALEVPQDYVSAVCFGGVDGRDLYVTTFGGPPYDPDHSGAVLRATVQVAGLPVTPALI
jgi:gluconolactonase